MKQFFAIIFFVVYFPLYSQITDTIEWRGSYKLTWDDFKGPVDSKSPHSAATGASILYDVKNSQDNMVCIIKVYFERQRSWMKNSGKVDYVLRHEQGHFDLYEIYARKLRKILQEKIFKAKSLEHDFKKVVKKVLKEADKEQKKYDKQTGHSLKESNQQKWTKNIADELKNLDGYKNPSIVLSIK